MFLLFSFIHYYYSLSKVWFLCLCTRSLWLLNVNTFQHLVVDLCGFCDSITLSRSPFLSFSLSILPPALPICGFTAFCSVTYTFTRFLVVILVRLLYGFLSKCERLKNKTRKIIIKEAKERNKIENVAVATATATAIATTIAAANRLN